MVICGPEITRILNEFEGTFNITSNKVEEHYNSTISAQSSFQKDLKLLFVSDR